MVLLSSLFTLPHRLHQQLRRLKSDSSANDDDGFLDYFTKLRCRPLDCDVLVELYTGHGYPARFLELSCINFYKQEGDGSSNEFLVAKVVDGTSQADVGFVRVQRTVRCSVQPVVSAASHARTDAILGASANTEPLFSHSSSPPAKAVGDVVTLSTKMRDLLGTGARSQLRHTYHLSPRERPESLLALIAAVSVAHDVHLTHQPWESSCFWFVGVVFELLAEGDIGETAITQVDFLHDVGSAWMMQIHTVDEVKEWARRLRTKFEHTKQSVARRRDRIPNQIAELQRVVERAEAEAVRAEEARTAVEKSEVEKAKIDAEQMKTEAGRKVREEEERLEAMQQETEGLRHRIEQLEAAARGSAAPHTRR